MKRIKLNQEDKHELNSLRTLIFLEIEPQSNKYNQLYLNAEQFKQVTKYFGKLEGKENDIEEVKIESSTEEYTLPDLKEIN